MILNTYAVLIVFVGLLRLVLGVLIVGLGVLAWRGRGAVLSAESRDALEDRSYLVFLLAVLLAGLNLASWPLLYLLLQSYVPEWPGVMCIYGVMQVGAGSMGTSRFLPDLLGLLQWTKPALVFAGGAWFVLYLLNRRTQTAPLLPRLFVALVPLGVLAVADAAAELAYIAIPKKEVYPSGGCCTVAFDDESTTWLLPEPLRDDTGRHSLYTAYYGGNGALVLALYLGTRRPDSAPGPMGLALLLLGGILVVAASGLFLIDVAAPLLLQLPYHHCPYDLVGQVPEAIVAIALFLSGFFLLGWACVARWFGAAPHTQPLLPETVCGLLRLSLWAYAASLAMLAVELALA